VAAALGVLWCNSPAWTKLGSVTFLRRQHKWGEKGQGEAHQLKGTKHSAVSSTTPFEDSCHELSLKPYFHYVLERLSSILEVW